MSNIVPTSQIAETIIAKELNFSLVVLGCIQVISLLITYNIFNDRFYSNMISKIHRKDVIFQLKLVLSIGFRIIEILIWPSILVFINVLNFISCHISRI